MMMRMEGAVRKSWKQRWYELQRVEGAGDRIRCFEKEGGKVKESIDLTVCQGATTAETDLLQIELTGTVDEGKGKGEEPKVWAFKCEDEDSCMMWVNRIMMSLAMRMSVLADEAAEALQGSGEVEYAKFDELVKSMGGDYKYIKEPELLEM